MAKRGRLSKIDPDKNQQKSTRSEPPEIEPRTLDRIDFVIIKFMVENPGCSDKDVAKFLNLHRQTIADRSKNPLFKMALNEQFKPAKKLLRDLIPSAIRKLGNLMQAEEMVNERVIGADGKETTVQKKVPVWSVQVKAATALASSLLKTIIKIDEEDDSHEPSAVNELSDEELTKIVNESIGKRSRNRPKGKARG